MYFPTKWVAKVIPESSNHRVATYNRGHLNTFSHVIWITTNSSYGPFTYNWFFGGPLCIPSSPGSTIVTILLDKTIPRPQKWQVASPLVIEGFSKFLGLFQVIMANPLSRFMSSWLLISFQELLASANTAGCPCEGWTRRALDGWYQRHGSDGVCKWWSSWKMKGFLLWVEVTSLLILDTC